MDETTEFQSILDPQLTLASMRRAERWHPGGVGEWTTIEWLTAFIGEVGELCAALLDEPMTGDERSLISAMATIGDAANAQKKLNRWRTGAPQTGDADVGDLLAILTRALRSLSDPRWSSIGDRYQEASDVVLYLPMLLDSLGVTPKHVAATFNRTSVKVGFPDRLAVRP